MVFGSNHSDSRSRAVRMVRFCRSLVQMRALWVVARCSNWRKERAARGPRRSCAASMERKATDPSPAANLTAGPKGELFGRRVLGSDGYGTVFRLTPPSAPREAWAETMLHSFR